MENAAIFLNGNEALINLFQVETEKTKSNCSFLVIVGPSASGKSTIISHLLRDSRFMMPRSVTTRKPRHGESTSEYLFVSNETFEQLKNNNSLFESSEYAGNKYGLSKVEVDRVRSLGCIPVKALDINGAKRVKQAFGDKAITVFIKRDKEQIIKDLSKRKASPEDIAHRIKMLDSEFQNEKECDKVVLNNTTIENAVAQIFSFVNGDQKVMTYGDVLHKIADKKNDEKAKALAAEIVPVIKKICLTEANKGNYSIVLEHCENFALFEKEYFDLMNLIMMNLKDLLGKEGLTLSFNESQCNISW